MFQLLPDLPPHAVAFVIDGTTTRPDVDALYREVEAAVRRGHVHLYGEIAGVGGLTLGALGANASRGLALLPSLGNVDRYAVVTDTSWISTAARLQGSLLPGLEVRTFPRSEREAALAWVAEPLTP